MFMIYINSCIYLVSEIVSQIEGNAIEVSLHNKFYYSRYFLTNSSQRIMPKVVKRMCHSCILHLTQFDKTMEFIYFLNIV